MTATRDPAVTSTTETARRDCAEGAVSTGIRISARRGERVDVYVPAADMDLALVAARRRSGSIGSVVDIRGSVGFLAGDPANPAWMITVRANETALSAQTDSDRPEAHIWWDRSVPVADRGWVLTWYRRDVEGTEETEMVDGDEDASTVDLAESVSLLLAGAGYRSVRVYRANNDADKGAVIEID